MLPALFLLAVPRTYVVDAARGDDAKDGVRTPWRTLARASKHPFGPGERLILKGWLKGTLRLRAKGERSRPVVVEGDAIEAGNGAALVAEDASDLVIRRLFLFGAGRKRGNDDDGLRLVRPRRVRVEDVRVAGFRSAGVRGAGGEDVVVQGVIALDNGFGGIVVDGDGETRARRWTIRDCHAKNNAGDPKVTDNHSGNGILVGRCDDGLIERCAATNNGWDMPRTGNGPVGIWGYEVRRLTIRRCISWANRSPGYDGGGFDLDGGCTDCLIEECLSYDNSGAGFLLCQYPGASVWRGNVVRRCVSVDDGWKHPFSCIGLWRGADGISDGLVEDCLLVNEKFGIASDGEVPGMVYRRVEIRATTPRSGDLRGSRFEEMRELPYRRPAGPFPTDPKKLGSFPFVRN